MILNLVVDFILILLAASAAALIAVYFYFQKKFKYWHERKVLYAKPSFPLGNLGGGSLAESYRKLYEDSKNERYYGIWQLHRPTLLVNEPELIKKICVSDFMNFHDHGIYVNEEKDPLAANLVSLEGTAWRNLRVKLTPTFTSGKMKLMFPILVKTGKEMQEVIKDTAKLEDVLEVKELTARFSTDVISSCAFGIESNSLKNQNSIIRQMGKKIFEPTLPSLLRNSISFLIPDLAKLLQVRQNPKDVSDFFLKAFRETMDYREKNDVKRNDVMQLLIQLKNKGYIEDVDSNNKQEDSNKTSDKFTFEQAAAQAFIFFVGGFETSSTTMQFTLYELALNQNIQSKVRDEIQRVTAKHNGELTYEAMNEMEYLGRVIDETLRKYPPGFILSRICTKDYKVPDSDLVVEKGTSIIIPAYGLHMDERYWPDPQKFDPDRFTEEQKSTRHHYTYLPFGEGPRVCIGQRFALMQTKVGLISLISKFRIEVSPKHTPIPIEFDPKSVVIAPKGGMNLKISLLDE